MFNYLTQIILIVHTFGEKYTNNIFITHKDKKTHEEKGNNIIKIKKNHNFI